MDAMAINPLAPNLEGRRKSEYLRDTLRLPAGSILHLFPPAASRD
jgi:hypothetical protein